MRLGVTWVKADGFAVGGLCFRVPIHDREQVPKVVMRVGVAWVEADGFAVGRLSVYVAVLAAKAVPCVSILLRLGGGCNLARGGAGLAGGASRTASGPGRRAGSLARSASSRSRSGPACWGGAGECVRMAAISAVRVAPLNGRVPSTAVYRVAPSAHMSAAASARVPSSCSGAMYSGVPIIIPVPVSL